MAGDQNPNSQQLIGAKLSNQQAVQGSGDNVPLVTKGGKKSRKMRKMRKTITTRKSKKSRKMQKTRKSRKYRK